MKRKQIEIAKSVETSGRKVRVIDASRLGGVRGGDGLGITVAPPDPNPSYMSLQHNETLIRL